MKFYAVLLSTAGRSALGAALVAFGLAAVGQTTTTRIVTAKHMGGQAAQTTVQVQKPAVRGAVFQTVKPQAAAAVKRVPVTKVVVQHKSTPKAVPVVVKVSPLLNGLHPNLPNPPGSTVNSVNFGSMEVHGLPVTMTLQYATPTATLIAATAAGVDFKVTSSSCGVSGCTVSVSFTASYPGLRRDAITLTDSGGNLVYETYVYGLGMGPQFGYELGTGSIYSGFTTSPMGVALGPDERVYYTSTGGNSVYVAARDFSSATVITLNGLGNPSGIAIDGSNTLYVADQSNNKIIAYSATGIQSTVTTTSLSGPSQIAVDGTGALYIADTGNGRVIKLDNHGNETTLASGLTTPEAVAVDSNGNVFYTDAANNGEIFKIAAGSTTQTTYQFGLNQVPRNLAVDASGAIYLTTDQGLNVFRPGSQVEYPAIGNDVLYGLAVDQDGDIFLTQPLDGTFTVDDRQISNFILSTPPGTTSSGNLTISNTGNETLTFGTMTLTGTVFSLDPSTQCTAGGALLPDATCDVVVDFMPPAAMDYHEVFTVTSDSLHVPGTADPFYLAGSGQGPDTTTALTASPNPVQAGNPVTLLVTVTDSSATFAGVGAVTFMDGSTVLGTGNLSPGIRPGTATTQFTVPSLSAGNHLIAASFPGDNNIRPSVSNTVTVVATNGPPPPNGGIPVGAQDFGSVTIGQSKSIDLTYPFAMNVPNINVAQNNDFTVSTVTCTTICTVTITFTPQLPGRRSDVVSVVDNGTGTLIAKTYLFGNGVGPQFGFDPGSNSVFSGVIQTPAAAAIGPFFTSYIADTATDQIYAVNSDQIFPLAIANLGTPGGVAVDAAQVVYVTDQTHNLIVSYDTVALTQGTVATSQLSQPTGIAVDGTGSIYITDVGNNRVLRIDNQGNETTLASGIASLGPIAVDSAGNVYYAITAQPGGITELPVGGGQPIVIANNIGSIHGLAVDAGNRVYYTNDAGLSIIPLPSCGGCPLEGVTLAGTGTNALYGLALDPNGDIYVTAPTTGQYLISKRSRSNNFVQANLGASAQQTFLVSNTGNAQLTISTLAFTGTAFTLDPSSACVNGIVVQAGMTCATVVNFTPTVPQSYQETLTFTSDSLNQAGSTNDYTLYGTGNSIGSTVSTTTLAVSPSTAVLGQPVTLTATVTEATNTPPSGTVNFLDGGTLIATAYLGYQLSGGTATAQYTTSSLAVGAHSITAVYSGDPNFAASTSTAQTVSVSATAPVVVSSKNFGSVAVGQSVSMTIFYTQGTNPTISAVNNLDFVVSTVSCTTGCTATITFVPQYPGLRTDAITVTGSGGALLAKTFIYGIGTAPQLGFNSGSNTIYPNFVPHPTAIALSPDGTPFVSDIGTNRVIAITLNQQSPLPITNLGVPAGLAIDGSDTLYVADQTNNVVRFYNLVTQAQGTLATTPLAGPDFLAVDGAGSVYISDNQHQRIIKVDNQGTETTVASGLNSPQGVAVDSAGNIYYTDAGSGGEIVELPVGGGQPITLGTNLGGVLQIAVDASGSVYYVGNFSLVRVIVPGVNNPSANFGILGNLSGIALGQNGDVYTTQASTGLYAVSTRGSSFFHATSPVGQFLQEPGFGVVNTGNAPLTISNLSFATGTVFTVDSGSPCVNGIVLGPGRICNTLVDFLPTAAQTYTDQLTYTSNSLNVAGTKNFNNQTGTGTGSNIAASTTTLVVSPGSPTLGQPVTFTATVSDTASVTPTGTVNFLDGTTVIGSGTLTASGTGSATAQFTTSSLALGGHSITVVYAGDPNVAASTSTATSVTVANAIAVINSQNFGSSAVAQQTVTLTLTYPIVPGGITIALVNNLDFTMTPQTCGATTCSTQVSFLAKFPGLRTDAVTVKDLNGNLTAKTFVYGLGTAPQSAFDQGLVSSPFTTPKLPTGVAIGSDRSLYMADASNHQVLVQFFAGGGGTIPVGNLGAPGGLAVDGSNTVYIADKLNNSVIASSANGVVRTVTTSALASPNFLAVDGTGALYIGDSGHNRIVRIDSQGVETTLVSGTTPLFGIAVDAAGDVFYADQGNGGEITELPAGGGAAISVGTQLGSTINALAVDPAGRLYFTALSGTNSAVYLLTPGSAAVGYIISSGTQAGAAIAIDGAGRFVISETSIGQVDVYDRYLDNLSLSNQVGTTGQAGITISNTGDTPLTINGFNVTGTVFTVDPANPCPVGTVIAPAHTCNVTVDFKPTAVQSYQATLTVSSNSLNTTTQNDYTLFGQGQGILSSTTTLGVSSNAVSVGQPVTFTATVSNATQTTPTGAVNFLDGTTVIGSANLGASTGVGTAAAQFTTTSLAVGGHPITAVYAGDPNVPGSTSSTQTVLVSQASTSTSLAVSAANVTVGQPETLTATIVGGASPVLTGIVTFFDGTVNLGSSSITATGTGGTAALTVATLGVGAHSITARYSGDTNYSVSTSAAQTVTVAQGVTTTTLGVSAATITLGQNETLTATIAGAASPVLSGTVTFFDGTVNLGTSAVTATSGGGTATLTVATLGVGPHSITARYSGDTNYTAGTSAAQTVTVTQITTTTSLGVSAANITLGQSETLTATIVGSASPALSGTVTFFDGTVNLGTSPVTVINGVGTATLTVTTLGVGSHSITARYSGDTNYTVSTSAAQTVVVGQGITSTTLGVSSANISLGQTETLTASLQVGASPAATGNVSFFDGTVLLGSTNITVTPNGVTAALTVNTLLAGRHSITARYNGDTNYAASTSAIQIVAVAQASTTTALGISAANISAGQSETLSVTVQGLAAPPLTSTVVFYDGLAVIGTQPLIVTGAIGSATLNVSTLAVGSHSITAMYSGDTNYAASTSAAQTVTVSLVAQTITFPTIPSHMFGDPPFVLGASASSGLTVSYTVVSGPATLSGSTLTLTGVGTVVIQATQAGNATYAAATSVTQSFAVATPTPTLTSFTPASAVIGSPAVTITLSGTNFSTSDTVQVNGTAAATTFVNATTLTAVIPASALATAATLQIRVSDASNGQITAALPFAVLATPVITFSGPTTVAPAQQPALTFQLVNPYPVAITTALTLTFTPQSAALTDDPAVQFAAGGRTLTFSIPANSQVTPAIQLQSGTVAGRVTVISVITANGVNVTPTNVVPVVITIPAVIPAISSATVTRNGKTLTVVVLGYSNTREVTTAMFHFTAANGGSISDPDVTAPVTSAFTTWFASPLSTPFGSTFTYTQDFTLSNDASTIGSVSVTLVNSIGTSAPGTAQ